MKLTYGTYAVLFIVVGLVAELLYILIKLGVIGTGGCS